MIALTIPQVPVIVTPRLSLRALAPRDFEPFMALHASPHAALLWGIGTRDAAWERFLACAGGWVVRGVGIWALTDRWSDRFVGQAGFFAPSDTSEPDLTVALTAEAEGRGLGEEAARAVRDWGRLNGQATPASTVDARNTRALRLAARLGAVETGRLTLSPDLTLLRYRHLAEKGAT